MILLITEAALSGAIIGRFFKILVLIPVSVVSAASLWVKCKLVKYTVLYTVADVGLLILNLDFGYFIGMLATAHSAAAQRVSGVRERPRH